jgi:hypothetical protein
MLVGWDGMAFDEAAVLVEAIIVCMIDLEIIAVPFAPKPTPHHYCRVIG